MIQIFNPLFDYTVIGSVIQHVDTYKYLGASIPINFTWDVHIVKFTRPYAILSLSRRLFKGTKNNRKKLETYKTLVRLYFEYTLEVWDPHTDKNNEGRIAERRFFSLY